MAVAIHIIPNTIWIILIARVFSLDSSKKYFFSILNLFGLLFAVISGIL
jgi:hypothetical protein